METGIVRNRVTQSLAALKERAQQRRTRSADAEQKYATFLDVLAIPIARQVAGALKAEGYAFTVFTPGGGLRLASDKGRDDFVEFVLDTSGDTPRVGGRISYTRGSRVIDAERVIAGGIAPDALSEEQVLEFLLKALEPMLER